MVDHGPGLTVARFLGPLDVRKLGRRRWMTLVPLGYESDVLGATITVPVEFITDFASVPRTPLAWWLVGDTAHRAAVVHDWLYQHPDFDDRRWADAVFREAMAADDQDPEPAWRRALAWLGVRIGGGWAWTNHGKRIRALNPIWTAAGWPTLATAETVSAP